MLVFTKMDVMEQGKKISLPGGVQKMKISAVRGDNLDKLKEKFFELIEKAKALEEG